MTLPDVEPPAIPKVLRVHEPARENLIPILQAVQEHMGYLSEDAVAAIADYLRVSQNDVFGVATFYTQFRFRPQGRQCVKVCHGTACHVRGSDLIMQELTRKLGIEPGETSADGEYSLEGVACFGSCALAPVVVVGDRVHGLVSPSGTETLIAPV